MPACEHCAGAQALGSEVAEQYDLLPCPGLRWLRPQAPGMAFWQEESCETTAYALFESKLLSRCLRCLTDRQRQGTYRKSRGQKVRHKAYVL